MTAVVSLRTVSTSEVKHKGKMIKLVTYDVLADGEAVGTVSRKMLTRERKTPGKTYVDARWKSPGWTSRDSRTMRQRECGTRREGIERVLRDQLGLSWAEAEKLAAAAKVVG